MNVIAGILIGVANDTWMARLAAPFIWGIVYCIYVSMLRRERLAAFVAKDAGAERGRFKSWSPAQVFYFIEYSTAATTSLVFSIGAGIVSGFFRG